MRGAQFLATMDHNFFSFSHIGLKLKGSRLKRASLYMSKRMGRWLEIPPSKIQVFHNIFPHKYAFETRNLSKHFAMASSLVWKFLQVGAILRGSRSAK